MSAPISADDIYKLRQQSPEPSHRPSREFPWTIVIVLIVLAAAGWGYYYFFVKYRLPQERTLYDQQGNAIRARLEGRDGQILRYTSLDDNAVHYLSVSRLSTKDQEFINHLASELNVTFPLDYLLPAAGGKTQQVRIDARSNDWVKYVNLSDNSVHYVPISSLPPMDQDVIRSQEANLVYLYPVEYDFSSDDPRGKVSWLGRNDSLVKYMTLKDNVVHYDLISELPSQEQSFVRQLADYVNIEYPVRRDLHSRDGKVFGSRVDGRSDAVVKSVSENNAIRYIALDDLSELDQRFVRALPLNLSIGYPLEMTRTSEGKVTRVRVEGRNLNLVRAATVGANSVDLFPISSFAPEEQKVLQMLPVNLIIRYPFDLVLVEDNGRRTQAQIMGRTPETVQFRMSDGKVYAYEIAKLSPATQEILQSFPANLGRIDTATVSGGTMLTVRPDQSALVRAQQTRIRQLLAEMAPGEAKLAASGLTISDRAAIVDLLNGPRKEAENCYKKIEEIQGKGARKGEPADVGQWRERIDYLMRDNDSIESRMTESRMLASSQKSAQTNLDRNRGEIVQLMRKIVAAVGIEKL